MAAFGPAVTRGQHISSAGCFLDAAARRRPVCTCQVRRELPHSTSRHRSFPLHCKPFDQKRSDIRAQAASDIALPASGGHAEEAVLPEPGLLHPSILNSQYDNEIVGLAVPALGSILLDPLLSLVDTGKYCYQLVCDLLAALHAGMRVLQ